MLGIQFALRYRSIFVSRVGGRDRSFLSPAGFVSHCCYYLVRQGNIFPPQSSLSVALLRLFVPWLIFFLKNRDKRLKSLNIFACVQIGMRIKFQSELCKFVRVWGNLKFQGIYWREARGKWPKDISGRQFYSKQFLIWCYKRKTYEFLTCTKSTP